jgi:hypothetical protein
MSQLRTHLNYSGKLQEIYYLHNCASHQSIVPSLPAMGRIGKDDLVQLIQNTLRSYEREFKELDLILIEEVFHLFTSIERSLSKPGEMVLLAGKAGVG